uniref:Ras-GAP domain-containing protein n=1 Tax=Steinernema glaseri TaxID=37863 RepID=A0A1I7YTY5_9BILA
MLLFTFITGLKTIPPNNNSVSHSLSAGHTPLAPLMLDLYHLYSNSLTSVSAKMGPKIGGRNSRIPEVVTADTSGRHICAGLIRSLFKLSFELWPARNFLFLVAFCFPLLDKGSAGNVTSAIHACFAFIRPYVRPFVSHHDTDDKNTLGHMTNESNSSIQECVREPFFVTFLRVQAPSRIQIGAIYALAGQSPECQMAMNPVSSSKLASEWTDSLHKYTPLLHRLLMLDIDTADGYHAPKNTFMALRRAP